MYRVALIQNQTYMTYASKTDVRSHLRALGYQVLFYTAQNINKLKHDLREEPIDAVLFSSNALNERSIWAEVESEAFAAVLAEFLARGKGCLVLHQLRMAEEGAGGGGVYGFLPAPFHTVRAVKREDDDPMAGDLKQTVMAVGHPALHYPSPVDLAELAQHCRKKKGLYWHYLAGFDPAEWDVLLHDEGEGDQRRPLVICSRESARQRIAVAALNLDWQKEERLFGNLLLYVIEGRCQTAVLKDPHLNSTSFDYFLAMLQSQQVRFRVYNAGEDLQPLLARVEQGLHSIVIRGPYRPEREPAMRELEPLLEQYALSGRIKYLGSEPKAGRFFVAGRERQSIGILFDAEVKVQNELKRGHLIDGSFWSTAEALKVLTGLPDAHARYDLPTVSQVFAKSRRHLHPDGSFDNNFHPTVALLWLRGAYLGAAHAETRLTLAWLRRAMGEEEPREQAVAFTTIIEAGLGTEEDRRALEGLIGGSDGQSVSETTAVVYLKAALALGRTDLVRLYAERLYQCHAQSREGLWIDLATAGQGLGLLLEARERLQAEGGSAAEQDRVEEMIFSTVLMIEEARGKSQGGGPQLYPWENKALTTLRCAGALLKFERLIDLPVAEMHKALISYSGGGDHTDVDRTALKVIEVFKQENVTLQAEADSLKTEVQQLRTDARERARTLQEQEGRLRKLTSELAREKAAAGEVNRHRLLFHIALLSYLVVGLLVVWGVAFFVSSPKKFAELISFVKENNSFISTSFALVPLLYAYLFKRGKERAQGRVDDEADVA